MPVDEEILQLQKQLLKLQIQTNQINNKIQTLRNKRPKQTKERLIQIGDEVRILNKGRFQEKSGKIIKIGKRVTIQTKSGQKIIRDPKNVTITQP